MKKHFIVVLMMSFIACGYLNAISTREYFMFDRLFAHDFDASNSESKPWGDKFISDKDMLASMTKTFSSSNINKNSLNVMSGLYNFITNIDKKIASGKCMLNPGSNGGCDGKDSLGYYSVFDLEDSGYEITVFDVFRNKIYKVEITLKNGQFTKLLGNIDFVLESRSEGKFPEFIGEQPYGTYSLDLRRMFGQYDCLKFDKPIVDSKKKISKKSI